MSEMTATNKQADARSPLHDFLAPDSIAIVGASADPTKRGYKAMIGLIKDGYKGAIYPINPKVDMILGVKTCASLADVPGKVDLALICTPAASLPGLLAECGKKGVKGAVILASGFRETGEAGAKLEDAMMDAARAGNVRIIGPNTSGMFNLHKKVNLLALTNVRPGDIGFISQSGNMLLALVLEAEHNGHVGIFDLRRAGQPDRHRLQRLPALSRRRRQHARRDALRRRLSRWRELPRRGARDHQSQAGGGVQVRLDRTGRQGGQFAYRLARRQLRDDLRSAASGGRQRGAAFRRDSAGRRRPRPAAESAGQARRGDRRRRRPGDHRLGPPHRSRPGTGGAQRSHQGAARRDPLPAGLARESGRRGRQQ